jgi:hypothetical protein
MNSMVRLLLPHTQFYCCFDFAVTETFALKTAAFLLGKIAYSESTPKRSTLDLGLVAAERVLIKNLVWMRPHERSP